jgi:uncharacterized protein (TIRG00374 family)
MLLLGAALLALVVRETDLAEVARSLEQVGSASLAAVLGSYGLGFVFRSAAWQLTLPAMPMTPRCFHRAFELTMFACALDRVTPLAGLGGEPVKAVLLKRDFGVRYRDATASLVLSRTTDVLAQVLFIAVGVACLLRIESLPRGLRVGAAAGLGAFALAGLLFFLAQRLRALALVRRLAARLGPRLGARALGALEALRDVEDALVGFYRQHRARFGLSLGASLAEWTTGTVAAWIALDALGHPVGWADAMAIESFVVLVRSSLFFVPADVGTQEGALVLACGALFGSPETGLAFAAIRRGADILWILWGLAVGSVYSFGSGATAGAAAASEAPPEPRGGAR